MHEDPAGPPSDAPLAVRAARPATASPLGLRATLLVLVGALGVTAVVFGGLALVLLLVPAARGTLATAFVLLLPVQSLAVLGVVHVGLRRAGAGWSALGFHRPTARLWHLAWQLPLLLVTALVVQVLVLLPLGSAPPQEDAVDDLAAGVAPGLVAVLLVTVVVVAPVMEETLFRGVLLGGLRRRWPTAVAVLVSAALFAAIHGALVVMPYLLVLGVGLAVLREVHRTLWAPVIAHAANNALASLSVLVLLTG